MRILIAAAASAAALLAQTPDVDEIMARVADNQTRSQEMRKGFVFHQRQLLRLFRGNGKLAREEKREYTVTPKDRGVLKDLIYFDGKYEHKGDYISYDEPGHEYKDMDIDGELIDDLSDDMTNDEESQDGIGRKLFPLTPKEQARYQFKLIGTETFRNRPVYRVAFEPHKDRKGDRGFWKGEALIDSEEYQLVLVTTKMAPNIPAAVRILLGTNVRGLGFSLTYEKFGEGVWFPVSYGGEFEVKAVFLYKRRISVSMTNSDFRRTDVSSNIAYAVEDH